MDDKDAIEEQAERVAYAIESLIYMISLPDTRAAKREEWKAHLKHEIAQLMRMCRAPR